MLATCIVVSILQLLEMASGPTVSWQIDRETMETVTDFIFLGSKITADGDCSHETKRRLLHGRKAMTNLSSILKNRDVTLPTKAHLVKAMVFRVVIYWCESWTIKKTEHWRTDAFELWCSRRLVRVPWTARRSNQSTWKEVNPEYSLKGFMLKLKLQYFGHLMRKADPWKRSWCWERQGRRRRGWQKMKWFDCIINSMDMSLSKLWKIVRRSQVCCKPRGWKIWTRLRDCTTFTEERPYSKVSTIRSKSLMCDTCSEFLGWLSGTRRPSFLWF